MDGIEGKISRSEESRKNLVTSPAIDWIYVSRVNKENRKPMDREVIVYSTPLCTPCEGLKNHLRSAGIPFVSKDVLMDEEAGEFLESRGIFTTPVLSVDGELLEGFRPDKVNDLLGIQRSAGSADDV